MITLTPKIYRKGMKHSLLSSNKIDTVKIRPISNLAAENTVFHSETITKIKLNGSEYSLPLDHNVPATHFHSVSNSHWGNIIVGTKEFAKARIECVLVSGKTRCKTDKVVQGIPTANIRLVGTSKIVARGGSSYGSYPDSSTLAASNHSIASWINSYKTETSESLTHDYSGATFGMNPFVRNVVPWVTPAIDGNYAKPTANDVISEWMSTNNGRLYVWWQSWSENSNLNLNDYSQFEMGSPNTVGRDIETWAGTRIVLHDIRLPISQSIIKLDDYNYEVNWTAPVRVAYAAASREFGTLGGEYDVDNYAYLDEVSSIVVELGGTPFSTDVQDIAYSLNAAGSLTTVTKDNYPIEIDAEEVFTSDTYKGWYYEDGFSGSFTRDGYLNQNGEWVAQEQSFVTDYIFLPRNCVWSTLPNNTIEWYLQGCFYDLEYNLEGTVSAPGHNVVDQMSFGNSKDRYVRLNGKIADLDSGKYFVQILRPYLWTDLLSKELLDKYAKGKYTVECTVNAEWAIRNEIKINTKMQVKLLDGELISRDGTVCTFEVKNIEKRYEQREFVFILKLLEV